MTQPCPVCEDFHWIPRESGAGWFRRDWRMLLDPAVTWMQCPACRREQPAGRRLREAITAMLLDRLGASVACWTAHGSWQRGAADDGQVLYRHGGLYCLPPGPMIDPTAWTIVSDMGVLRGLDVAACRQHVQESGRPPVNK